MIGNGQNEIWNSEAERKAQGKREDNVSMMHIEG